MGYMQVGFGALMEGAVRDFNVRRGSKGENVMLVQSYLNAFGCKPALVLDGDFGPLTETAVRGFQKANNLTVDGIVGPETSHALQDDDSHDIGFVAPKTQLPARQKGGNTLLYVAGGLALVGIAAVVAAKMKKRKAA